jgi:hypothetical protein
MYIENYDLMEGLLFNPLPSTVVTFLEKVCIFENILFTYNCKSKRKQAQRGNIYYKNDTE